ncbi:MAG: protein-glutamate O-methyltransferase CheR [Bdellovibrionales bacterium]|nr:protein-glutamate O-methyltransferase CheR [Bdellovibrionales bacterium]
MKKFNEQGLKSRAEQNFELFNALQKDRQGFNTLREMLHRWTGIHLTDGPASQLKMANRLTRVLCRHELRNYQQYAERLRAEKPGDIAEFVSAMTTNTTRFFREGSHFETLRTIMAEVIETKKRDKSHEIRVWCAATSTGEEAYTLAISVNEALHSEPDLKAKILATDIDLSALQRAATGIYSQERLAKLEPSLVRKYFSRCENADGEAHFQVQPQIQKMVHFAPFNLHTNPYPFERGFDIIFCRNVLIYFSQETAQKIIERLTGALNPGGYLFVGHSEVGYVRAAGLKMKEYSIYRKSA